MSVTKITYKNGPAKCWTKALSEMYQGTRDYLKLAEYQPTSKPHANPSIPAVTEDHTTK